MPLILLGVVLLLPLLWLVLLPLSLVQRYRFGTARRLARGWVATLNLLALAFSIALLLAGALISSVWAPPVLGHTSLGLAGGALLGFVAVLVSRWEVRGPLLHYTPNRWLVLGMVAVVGSRFVLGLWHTWRALQSQAVEAAWTGAAATMGVGAMVLGYSFAYWLGVRVRVARHAGAIRQAQSSRGHR